MAEEPQLALGRHLRLASTGKGPSHGLQVRGPSRVQGPLLKDPPAASRSTPRRELTKPFISAPPPASSSKAHPKSSQIKVCSSRRQESHMKRWRVTGAGAGARECSLHHPSVSRKSPARDEPSFGCVVQTRQCSFNFSLRCVGFSRSSVLKFPFKRSW